MRTAIAALLSIGLLGGCSTAPAAAPVAPEVSVASEPRESTPTPSNSAAGEPAKPVRLSTLPAPLDTAVAVTALGEPAFSQVDGVRGWRLTVSAETTSAEGVMESWMQHLRATAWDVVEVPGGFDAHLSELADRSTAPTPANASTQPSPGSTPAALSAQDDTEAGTERQDVAWLQVRRVNVTPQPGDHPAYLAIVTAERRR